MRLASAVAAFGESFDVGKIFQPAGGALVLDESMAADERHLMIAARSGVVSRPDFLPGDTAQSTHKVNLYWLNPPRYVLAWDHALCRAVVGCSCGPCSAGCDDGRATGGAWQMGGAVAIIQRFGAALNLNVHVHALVVDGVYAEDGSGTLGFHPAPPPTDEEMDQLLGAIERRIRRLLARRGVAYGGDHGPDRWSEEAPVRAGIADASVQGRIAFGPRAGAEVRRCGRSPDLLARSSSARGPCHARQNGFDLHAAVVVPGRDRARLERVCRDALRPPVAHDRIG